MQISVGWVYGSIACTGVCRSLRVVSMIEAVNAVISTAPSVRAMAQQVASAESFSANPANLQKAAMTTAYSSKYIQLAPDIKPIFVVRDTNTGESVRQFPTEAQIRAYQRAQESRATAKAQAQVETQIGGNDAAKAQALAESSVQYKEVRQQIKQPDAPPPPLPGQTKVEVKMDFQADIKLPGTVKTGGSAKTGGSFSADV